MSKTGVFRVEKLFDCLDRKGYVDPIFGRAESYRVPFNALVGQPAPDEIQSLISRSDELIDFIFGQMLPIAMVVRVRNYRACQSCTKVEGRWQLAFVQVTLELFEAALLQSNLQRSHAILWSIAHSFPGARYRVRLEQYIWGLFGEWQGRSESPPKPGGSKQSIPNHHEL
jgi:hypothetical protein